MDAGNVLYVEKLLEPKTYCIMKCAIGSLLLKFMSE